MAIFAPPLRRTLQEFRDEPEGQFVRKPVRSAGWNGAGNLSGGEDTAATAGYLLDYANDAAQFEKLFIKGGIATGVATAAGRLLVTAGVDSIVERLTDSVTVTTAETRTSSSYGDLATAGPAVTVTTGTKALIIITTFMANNTAGSGTHAGFAVSGASTIAATDAGAFGFQSGIANQDIVASFVYIEKSLTAGSNTFTMKYRIGTSGTGTWKNRRIAVVPLS